MASRAVIYAIICVVLFIFIGISHQFADKHSLLYHTLVSHYIGNSLKLIIPTAIAYFAVFRVVREWMRRDEIRNFEALTEPLKRQFEALRVNFEKDRNQLGRHEEQDFWVENDIELVLTTAPEFQEIIKQFCTIAETYRYFEYGNYRWIERAIDGLQVQTDTLENGVSSKDLELNINVVELAFYNLIAEVGSVINQSPNVFKGRFLPNNCFTVNRNPSGRDWFTRGQ